MATGGLGALTVRTSAQASVPISAAGASARAARMSARSSKD
jgi:hypothetical protein